MKPLSLKILLVDDDEEDRQLIRWALTNALENIVIEEMTTGQELIDWLAWQRKLIKGGAAVKDNSVTILLLDMHMPKLTGLETLKSLGDLSDFAYMPIVMLTGSIDSQLKQLAYELGVYLYMVKPTGPRGFYRVVEAVKLCYWDTLRMREQQEMSGMDSVYR